MFLEVVATIGSILCVACALPQLILTFKQGNTIGFSTSGLILKFLAALLMTIYAIGLPLPIYVVAIQLYNDILVSVQMYYCFFPRKPQ
jgi:uncharacterized protein with PQ loop repeat